MAEGDVELSAAGFTLAEAELPRQKEIFAEHLLHHVPLVADLHREVLARGRVREEEVLDRLEMRFPPGEARRVWRRLLEWGRFAGLLAYDERARLLFPPEEEASEA